MQKDFKLSIFQVIGCDQTKDFIPGRMEVGNAEGMEAEVKF